MASQEERDRIMAEYLASVQDDDDDDDDDEDEFQPGDDEDDDDGFDGMANENDEKENGATLLAGHLSYDAKDRKLTYRGKDPEGQAFLFVSSQPLHWDMADPTNNNPSEGKAAATAKPSSTSSSMRTVTMEGTLLSSSDKAIQLDLTFRKGMNDGDDAEAKLPSAGALLKSPPESSIGKPVGKSTGEEDDEEGNGKMPAAVASQKAPPVSLKAPPKKTPSSSLSASLLPSRKVVVFGKGPGFELYGQYTAHDTDKNNHKEDNDTGSSVELNCQHRSLLKAPPTAAAAAAVGGGTAAPAAVAKAGYNDNDDDDVEADVDEGVDFDELLALRQDAGVPVAEVRKRYATRGSTAKPPPAKRGKSDSNNNSNDSDEEYGF